MTSKLLLPTLGAGLMLQACSSTPREFVPTLARAPADPAKFEEAYAYCRQLLVERKLHAPNTASTVAMGAVSATGPVAALGTAGAIAANTTVAGAALASATLVALPVVAVGSMVGSAKVQRKRKETASQWIMTGCLRSKGYEVAGWTRAATAGSGAGVK